jgi:DNA-binding SARP family transcriptional activator
MLRPLPGERASGQPALAAFGYEGLTAIGGRRHVASENVAQILAERNTLANAAWLRLEALDAEPHCLMESLVSAAAHAMDSPNQKPQPWNPDLGVPSHSEAGRRLAEHLSSVPVVVLEDEHPNRATARTLEALVAYLRHADPGALAVYLRHGPLPRNVAEVADVVIEGNGGHHPELRGVLADGDSGFSVSSLARLMSLAGHQHALLNDVLDATAERDPDLVAHLTVAAPRRRPLERRINARLLPRLSPAEVQALSIARQTGYWHPSLSDRTPQAGMTLRPWMLPLEEGWWWLRPLWRQSLAKFLDTSHRTGRRFFAAYRMTQTDDATPPLSSRQPRESPTGAGNDRVGVVSEVQDDDSGDPRSETELPNTISPAIAGNRLPGGPQKSLIVTIRMFGAFEVEVDGRPIPKWHGRRGRSIFAYLLLQQQRSAAKDQLFDVFWPDAEPISAQNRLRVAVSSLRRDLKAVTDQQVVEFHDGSYRIDPNSEIRLDADDFERSAKEARSAEALGLADEALAAYSQALDCYRADLLTDMPYEEWTVLPREALRVSYLECLSDAASLNMSRGAYGEVLRLAWATLAADPLREDAHRLIMRCHAAQGRLHQSQRQFELCRHELATTLGVEPAPETVKLLEAIRNGESPDR